MASQDRKTRCREVTGTILLVLFLSAKRMSGQKEGAILPIEDSLERQELAIMDRLVQTYGSTDWSAVADFIASNPGSEGNPNIMFISLSLGNVYLNRYERGNDSADLDRAFSSLEWVAANHELWGDRWLAAPVASYLAVTSLRLSHTCVPVIFASRSEVLQQGILEILEEEADLRLSVDFPYQPYASSETGDSKGEEDAWEAGLLAAAANLLPNHPHASSWQRKGRQLAYDAITRPSDPPDEEGLKVSTVEEDFTLANHGFFPNPTYAAATIELLLQSGLTYRLSNREIPQEFGHNLGSLYETYASYVDSDLQWIVPSDPTGEASLFPFFFDPEMEDREVRCEGDNGYLWQPTPAVTVMSTGVDLWTAVLNAKVVMFYLMGSYLWRFPEGCPGILETP